MNAPQGIRTLPIVSELRVTSSTGAAVHLWLGDSRLESADEAFWRSLDEADRKYVQAAGTPEVTRQRLLSRAGLRLVVAETLDLSPGEVPVVRTELGAPRLSLPDAPAVSTSHSGPWIVWAVGSAPFGVDVECPRPGWDWEEVSDICFSPWEAARLRTIPPAERAARCLRLWALKEACLKATGRGLRIAPESFSLWWREGRAMLAEGGGDFFRGEWVFAEFDLPGGTAGAVAMRGARGCGVAA